MRDIIIEIASGWKVLYVFFFGKKIISIDELLLLRRVSLSYNNYQLVEYLYAISNYHVMPIMS